MRITSKGMVTIPAAIRTRAGLLPNTEVHVDFDGQAVRILPVRTEGQSGKGAWLVAHLKGRGDIVMSTDEIMTLTRGE